MEYRVYIYLMSTRTRINKFDLCAFTGTLRFHVFLFSHAKTVTACERDGKRWKEREGQIDIKRERERRRVREGGRE